MDLRHTFGPIDIYLFDQLLKGRVPTGSRILDAGCGSGRNLVYLLQQGYDVTGTDEDPTALASASELARALGRPEAVFLEGLLESRPWGDATYDLVICNAVLHFARNEAHFDTMLDACWQAVAPGGLFFSRLASQIGAEGRFETLAEGRYRLTDGSQRFLVDETMLLSRTERLGGELADPIKTTVVQGARCMTTWVLAKP